MCPRRYINLISNGLANKMVDELGLIFFFPNIITKESIRISMWKLNKLHDTGLQSMGDKENEKVIQNRLKSFIDGSLVHLVYFPCTISVIRLYNGAIYLS